jgi:hypothetical protein
MLNDWIAYKKIINCTNIIELRLYIIKCKWENKIRKIYHLNWEGGVEL